MRSNLKLQVRFQNPTEIAAVFAAAKYLGCTDKQLMRVAIIRFLNELDARIKADMAKVKEAEGDVEQAAQAESPAVNELERGREDTDSNVRSEAAENGTGHAAPGLE